MVFLGTPGGIRTPGLPVRSRTLYPAKLRVHITIIHTFLTKIKIFSKTSCKLLKFMLYYIGAKKSRCSAVGSARGLGP